MTISRLLHLAPALVPGVLYLAGLARLGAAEGAKGAGWPIVRGIALPGGRPPLPTRQPGGAAPGEGPARAARRARHGRGRRAVPGGVAGLCARARLRARTEALVLPQVGPAAADSVPKGRQPIARGVSPWKIRKMPPEPRSGGSSWCRPCGAGRSKTATFPGAHAPGYRLSRLRGWSEFP